MAFSATTSLEDLRPFVLGDHALHLQQQVFFGTVADGPIQKDQFDATPPQLLDKQNLVGVLPGQAIRRMHVQAVKGARIGRVAQSFQRGTRQRRSTVAFVDEAKFFFKGTAVAGNTLLECFELAADRVLFRLLLRGNPRVNRHSNVMALHGNHAPFATEHTAGERSGTPGWSGVVRRPRRRVSIGTASSKARARICFSSRPPAKRRSMVPNPHRFRSVPSMASSSLRSPSVNRAATST